MEKTYHKVISGDKIEELKGLIAKLQDFVTHVDNLPMHSCVERKSVVHDVLAKRFSQVVFEETPLELDCVSDVDYMSYIGEKAFGLQIRLYDTPISERMRASFRQFEEDFGGKVFVVFSPDGEVGNEEVLQQIEDEIARLKAA